MNPELNNLEKELKRLRPKGPSASILDRLEAELGEPVSRRREPVRRVRNPDAFQALEASPSRWRWLRASLALAASLAFGAVVLWLALSQRADSPLAAPDRLASAEKVTAPASVEEGGRLIDDAAESRENASAVPAGYQPRQAKNRLLNRIDEGIVLVGDGLPARQYRYQFMDTVVWENPEDGSEIKLSVPREEIVYVPIHTF